MVLSMPVDFSYQAVSYEYLVLHITTKHLLKNVDCPLWEVAKLNVEKLQELHDKLHEKECGHEHGKKLVISYAETKYDIKK